VEVLVHSQVVCLWFLLDMVLEEAGIVVNQDDLYMGLVVLVLELSFHLVLVGPAAVRREN
jgi:hypothetical protein